MGEGGSRPNNDEPRAMNQSATACRAASSETGKVPEAWKAGAGVGSSSPGERFSPQANHRRVTPITAAAWQYVRAGQLVTRQASLRTGIAC